MNIGNRTVLLLSLFMMVGVMVILFTPAKVPKAISSLVPGATNYPDSFSMYSQGVLGGKLFWRSCEDRSGFSLSKQQVVGSDFMNSTFYTGVKCNQTHNKYPSDIAVGQFENLDNKYSLRIISVRNFNPTSYDLDLDYGDGKVTSSYGSYDADYCAEEEESRLTNLFVGLCQSELVSENAIQRFCANSNSLIGHVTCFSAIQPKQLN